MIIILFVYTIFLLKYKVPASLMENPTQKDVLIIIYEKQRNRLPTKNPPKKYFLRYIMIS